MFEKMMKSWSIVQHGASLLVATALLAGCASVAPPSALQQASQRHTVSGQPSPAAQDAQIKLGVPARNWWEALGDPRLNELVRLTMAQNHDLQAALAVVKEARAMVDFAQSNGLPQGRLEASARRMRPSLIEVDPYRLEQPRPPQLKLGTIAQGVSWELDLFGRVGTAKAIAERQLDAARADAHAATAMLQAEVVRQYVALRYYQQQARQLDDTRVLLTRKLSLMKAREQAGLADRREWLAVEADIAATEAERAQVQAAQKSLGLALAVLTGRSPLKTDAAWEALLAEAELPAVPDSTRLAQPSDLLANRPDVARADAILRASLGNVVLAEREHLPRLSLNLLGGVNAPFGQLGRPEAVFHSVGAALQWDWLDAGRISAQAAAARAGSEQAWHSFEQTVLNALADSEQALRQWSASQATRDEAIKAEAAIHAVAAHTRVRVAAGMEPPNLEIDQSLGELRARRASLTARTEALNAFTNLQLALGAWQPEGQIDATR